MLKLLPVLGSGLMISKTVKVSQDCNLRKAEPNKRDNVLTSPNLFGIMCPNIGINF